MPSALIDKLGADVQLKVIDKNDEDFHGLLDEIIEKVGANPIYGSAHREYYREYFNHKVISDEEIIIVYESTPLIAFLMNEFEVNSTQSLFNYFGMPGLLLIDTRMPYELQISARVVLENHLRQRKLFQKFNNSNFSITSPFSSMDTIDIVEPILKAGLSHHIYYERVIDLSLSPKKLFLEFSKSSQQAIKNAASIDSTFSFFTENSASHEQSFALASLRELHLQAAGRVTRPESTWELQLQQLKYGSAVISLGEIDSKLVHGSLFLLTGKTALYGVSANLKLNQKKSISHNFMYLTILELQKLGVKKLYMGTQYEHFDHTTSPKEKGISQFKSFFGGYLKLFYGVSSSVN